MYQLAFELSFILRNSMPPGSFLQLSMNFGKSIPTTAYQTFLFVSDSVKLGRACSSDVYSVLRTKADGFCYSCEP